MNKIYIAILLLLLSGLSFQQENATEGNATAANETIPSNATEPSGEAAAGFNQQELMMGL